MSGGLGIVPMCHPLGHSLGMFSWKYRGAGSVWKHEKIGTLSLSPLLFAKANREASSDSRGGEMDSTSGYQGHGTGKVRNLGLFGHPSPMESESFHSSQNFCLGS